MWWMSFQRFSKRPLTLPPFAFLHTWLSISKTPGTTNSGKNWPQNSPICEMSNSLHRTSFQPNFIKRKVHESWQIYFQNGMKLTQIKFYHIWLVLRQNFILVALLTVFQYDYTCMFRYGKDMSAKIMQTFHKLEKA